MPRPFTRRAGWLRALMVSGCLLVAHVAVAQRAWTPPVTLTPGNQQAKRPQLAIDGAGNAISTWIREQAGGPTSRVTQASRLTSTGLWSPVQNLYTPAATAAVPGESTDVSLNAAGRGAAVWVRATGVALTDQIVQAAIFNGASWGSAVNLMPASAANTRSPRVGVDSDGNAIAVWVQTVNGFVVVRAARYQAGGTWSAPVTVSSPTDNIVEGVALAVDAAGNAVAVWTDGQGGVSTLRSSQFTELTNSWAAPVPIAPAGRAPSVVSLVMNQAGTAAFVAYRGFDGTRDVARASRLDPVSGAWSAPADLSTAGQDVFELDIAVDEQGRAVAAWIRFDGQFRIVQTARYTGSWTIPSERTSGADARDVSVDTDAIGNAIATWTRFDGSRYRVQSSAFAVATNAWSPAADVSDTNGDAAAPRVRLHGDGTAVVVWQSLSDYYYVQASRYVLANAPVLQPAVVAQRNVTLSWVAGTGPAPNGYTVVASRTPSGPPFVFLPVGNQTSIVVPAQDGGYYVRVLANISGVQVSSNEIEVIVGVGPPPTAPQNLSAVVNGSTFTMTWDPPLNAASAVVLTYYIAAGSSPGVSNLAFFPTGNALTTFTTPPVPNGSYWVRVMATSAGGLGPATPDLRVVIGPPPPGAPVLSGGATGPGTVAVQWTAAPAPGAPVTGYQLSAGYQPGQSNAAVFTFPAGTLSYAAANVPPGTYYVRVTALSSAGPGTTSNEIVVTVQ